jgi:predicted RecA/RadA family phage recombinase
VESTLFFLLSLFIISQFSQLCCILRILPFLSVVHFSPVAVMQIPSTLVLFFALFVTVLAAPLREIESRAAAAVFKPTTYNALSISAGKAGNAKAEALAKLSGLNTNDLADVAKADLDFLNSVNQIANDAEDEAFNPAIAKASGAAKTALQVCVRLHLDRAAS